jgi:hypothetical protein
LARSEICIADSSAMLAPFTLDERAASMRLVPPQSGQVANTTARSTKARTRGCIASTSLDSIDFWIFGINPS